MSDPIEDEPTKSTGWDAPLDILSFFRPPPLEKAEGLSDHLTDGSVRYFPLISDALSIGQSKGLDCGALLAAFLATTSAAIPNYFRLHVDPERHADWFESACIWTILIGEPSIGKSRHLALAKAPLEPFDRQLAQEHAERMTAYYALKPRDRTGAPPAERCILVDDVTPAKLRELLRDNPDRLLLATEEASKAANMPANDRAIFNKSYSGEAHKVHRKTSASVQSHGSYLSILMASQPDIIRKSANNFQDDGFWTRFIPIIMDEIHESKLSDCTAASHNYNHYVTSLCEFKNDINFYDDNTRLIQDGLRFIFSEEGQSTFRLCQKFITDYESIKYLNQKLSNHIEKYRGLLARICLIIHVCESVNLKRDLRSFKNRIISKSTIVISFRILRSFFLPHAYAFYQRFFATPGNEYARRGAEMILAKSMTTVSASKLKGMPSQDAIKALEALERADWIRPIKPLSKIYDVNPAVFVQFQDNQSRIIKNNAEARKQIMKILLRGKLD